VNAIVVAGVKFFADAYGLFAINLASSILGVVFFLLHIWRRNAD
jgi:MFS transporter, PHS family, inorganic phosphate transporter